MGGSMSNKVILLSGVHGVGKGYLLKKLVNDDQFKIVEASGLISRYKKADDAGYKRVNNVFDNQQILLKALAIEKDRTNKDIILDGHVCIINASGNVECISEKFVFRARVSGIILLQDDVDKIIQRQSQRDGLAFDGDLIKRMQEKEYEYCPQLFSKYNIKFDIIDSSYDYIQFCRLVERM